MFLCIIDYVKAVVNAGLFECASYVIYRQTWESSQANLAISLEVVWSRGKKGGAPCVSETKTLSVANEFLLHFGKSKKCLRATNIAWHFIRGVNQSAGKDCLMIRPSLINFTPCKSRRAQILQAVSTLKAAAHVVMGKIDSPRRTHTLTHTHTQFVCVS